ncbi:hypothetical protein OUZ56_021240 [Daphnia magna]|uniref:Uncharacterized protein n=1 Tax=Daphnia magna TaxID=35525 RepID=A0ABQ9ZGT4_9CRUS|nr:hypothetical protein OUZ56_021240 [Daphnia magna]
MEHVGLEDNVITGQLANDVPYITKKKSFFSHTYKVTDSLDPFVALLTGQKIEEEEEGEEEEERSQLKTNILARQFIWNGVTVSQARRRNGSPTLRDNRRALNPTPRRADTQTNR